MNLFLVGMMGSGKTSVGKRLSRRLGYRFLDTDQFIEQTTGTSISEIFRTCGEAHFRELEARLAKRLERLDNYVVSTGGGFLTAPGNLERLKAAGVVVFLNAARADILKRLAHDTKRPKVQEGDLEGTVDRLLAERMPLYTQAHVTVPTEGRSPHRVAGEIIRRIGELRGDAPAASTAC